MKSSDFTGFEYEIKKLKISEFDYILVKNYGVNQGWIGHIAFKNHVELAVFEFWTSVLNPVKSDDFKELSWAQKHRSKRVLQPIYFWKPVF